MNKLIPIFLGILLISCTDNDKVKKRVKFDIQGHRGARGLYPENTIPAFLHALNMGVTTLELDLAVTADGQLLVSHEPYMSSKICLNPDFTEISETEAIFLNIFKMDYDEVASYDCGIKRHPDFPGQQNLPVAKPLLKDVFAAVESAIDSAGLNPVFYNIEIKSMEGYDNVYHPEPEAFADLVYAMVSNQISWDRVTIQSFDLRVLRVFKQKYPEVMLAILIENELPWNVNIDSLGFKPAIYSSYFKRHTEANIAEIRKAGMIVIPWTVNETADMQKLIDWGVDGIITDYPDRLIAIRKP